MSVLAGVALTALCAVGCGGDEAPASQDHAVTEEVSHAAAIGKCQTAKIEALDEAVEHKDIGEVLFEWSACMAAANDSVAPQLEKNLAAIESELTGQTLTRFKGQRAASDGLCPVIVDASPEPGGLVAGTYAADCDAGLEELLAKLIAGFGGLADEAHILLNEGEMSEQFPVCYAAFEAASGVAASQNELADATFGLASCLQESLRLMLVSDAGLVGFIAQSFPERPREEIEAAVVASLDATYAAQGATCDLLTEAGIDGGSFLAHTLAGSCRAEAAQHLHGYITSVVGPIVVAGPAGEEE